MAHIPDGVLSLPVLASAGAATAALTLVAVKRMDYDRIPQAAVLASAFFVASLVTVPVGPSSVHLILNGLMGVLLGWAAVPALLVALCMQAVFFGYGGLSVLGVNALNLALPALLCAWLIAPRVRAAQGRAVLLWGGLAGALGVGLTGGMVMVSLLASGPEYLPAAKVILLTYLPLLVVEAAVTASALSFMKRVAPELLTRGEGR